MEMPGIQILISMLKKGLAVEGISEVEVDALNETIKTLEDLEVIGGINTAEDMKKISDVVNDLRYKMEKHKK